MTFLSPLYMRIRIYVMVLLIFYKALQLALHYP